MLEGNLGTIPTMAARNASVESETVVQFIWTTPPGHHILSSARSEKSLNIKSRLIRKVRRCLRSLYLSKNV